MKILMLGWEFPPFIAGGLGVACYGLTRALDRLGHSVLFVLPKPIDRSHHSHVTMLAPGSASGPGPGAVAASASLAESMLPPGTSLSPSHVDELGLVAVDDRGRPILDPQGRPLFAFRRVQFRGVSAGYSNPYSARALDASPAALADALAGIGGSRIALGIGPDGQEIAASTAEAAAAAGHSDVEWAASAPQAPMASGMMGRGAGVGYEGLDLIEETERYTRLAVSIAAREQFDVIHAHDWLTFPAGLALKAVTRRPLVVHVHSTEFDRSGANVNQKIFDIERAGMIGADRVIAVSQLTKNICVRRMGATPGKVDVIYNGIEPEAHQPREGDRIESEDKIVLFLGRITMQKGPEYFIGAAKRVLEVMDNVKFVLAGSGDMALRMIELAASLGIGHKVLFTGFLRGRDVDRVYRMADCYVMPSVSEPFGLAALEAISHDVPVILSKTSGASEVLTHVLKVDFWDTDEMANKIVAVLKHPPLSQTLRQHGSFELHRLTWEGAAERCIESYGKAIKPE